MKNILAIILLGLIPLIYSCKKTDPDPCKDIICLNGGNCVNGACDCPTGYGGPDCSNQITPSKINLTSVRVTKFPATDNGAGWDIASGPDIFINIYKGTTLLYTHAVYFENADPSKDYDFVLNPLFQIDDPLARYTIELLDYDDFSADDFMGGIEFTPYSNTNGFPTSMKIDAGGTVAFTIYMNYLF
jgi:EGF domain-containing protein